MTDTSLINERIRTLEEVERSIANIVPTGNALQYSALVKQLLVSMITQVDKERRDVLNKPTRGPTLRDKLILDGKLLCPRCKGEGQYPTYDMMNVEGDDKTCDLCNGSGMKTLMITPGYDHIGVAVSFFCYDGAGRFVMGLRGPNCRDEHGRWDIGGGSVDVGERVEDALVREILEEYGAPSKKITPLGYRDVHRDDGSHWISLDYAVHVDANAVTNCEPHKLIDVQFFTLESVPENVHSQFWKFCMHHAAALKGLV